MKIFPKDIRELKYIKTLRYDVELYLIDETRRRINYCGIDLELCCGQVALREMLNKNYRIRENPWCILKNELNPHSVLYGKLSLLSIWSWSHYSLFPKVAAFRYNKLIGIKHSSHTNPDFVWWDRQNFPYTGCPVNVDGQIMEIDDERNVII